MLLNSCFYYQLDGFYVGVGADYARIGRACVSLEPRLSLASRDDVTLSNTMTAAFVMSREKFYTAKLTAT